MSIINQLQERLQNEAILDLDKLRSIGNSVSLNSAEISKVTELIAGILNAKKYGDEFDLDNISDEDITIINKLLKK